MKNPQKGAATVTEKLNPFVEQSTALDAELGKLHVFRAVYETRSVTRAAQLLNVTPSAISQAIKALETSVKAPLFRRMPREMQATPEAERLYSLVHRFSNDLSDCIAGLRTSRKEPAGVLRIGATPDFGARKVPELLGGFTRFARARFRLELGAPDEIMERLVRGHLDLALCEDGLHLKEHSGVAAWRSVYRDRSLLVSSPSLYRTKVRGHHDFETLARLPHVDFRDDGRMLKLWYQHHFRRVPPLLDLKLTGGSPQAMVSAALAGLGLAFVPESLVEKELSTGKLVPIPTGRPEYMNPIYLVQLKSSVPSPLYNETLKALKGA